MHRPRASLTLRGTFTHEEYRLVCEALDEIGSIYNSMCSVESSITIASAYLHSDSSSDEIEAVIRRVLGQKILDINIDVEEPHAANGH